MTPQKIATVVGATGSQGSAVLKALQEKGGYHIRAVTRRSDSPSAVALSAQGVEIVQADLADESSLVAAFAGSHLVFGVTDYAELVAVHGPEKGYEIEGQFGLNIARAVAATPTVDHFIWSTLPRSKIVSGGKIAVPHYESKGRVDDYVQANTELLAKTTFVWVGWYDSNFGIPLVAPIPLPGTDKYFVMGDWPADISLAMIGDVKSNLVPFITAILTQPEKTKNGAIVMATTGTFSFEGWLQIWGKVHSKNLSYVKIDTATYLSLWPGFSQGVSTNLEYFRLFPIEQAWSDPTRKLIKPSELGINPDSFVPHEESLRAYPPA